MKDYIVTKYNKEINFIEIDKIFKNKEDAKKYCESKLNEIEIEQHNKMLNRGLIKETEFSSNKFIYEIEEMEVN